MITKSRLMESLGIKGNPIHWSNQNDQIILVHDFQHNGKRDMETGLYSHHLCYVDRPEGAGNGYSMLENAVTQIRKGDPRKALLMISVENGKTNKSLGYVNAVFSFDIIPGTGPTGEPDYRAVLGNRYTPNEARRLFNS